MDGRKRPASYILRPAATVTTGECRIARITCARSPIRAGALAPPQYLVQGVPAPQAYPAGYWQPAPYQQVQQPPRTTDGLAIASMVLGIVWVLWVGSILAVIFGHISVRRIKREGKAGRGMAIAGLVLGYFGVGTLKLLVLVRVIFAATGS
jgi:Domain of unknown function (DUF4190)